jgi:hypothetical protein
LRPPLRRSAAPDPRSADLASAYATDDTHPVKAAVDQAVTEAGWRPEPWYATMREHIVGRLGTAEGIDAAATDHRLRRCVPAGFTGLTDRPAW